MTQFVTVCTRAYNIFEKVKSKFKISDSDIVMHPCKDIDLTYLCEWNYIKNGEKVHFFDLGLNKFRSSRMKEVIAISLGDSPFR